MKALFDISHALGVNINWFFNGDDDAGKGEARYITRGNKRRSIRHDSGIVDQKLNTAAVAGLEFLYSTFAAQATSAGEPYNREGEECGLVISGNLQTTIDGVSYQLGKGDSFSFPSSLKHSYANLGAEAAEVICVLRRPRIERTAALAPQLRLAPGFCARTRRCKVMAQNKPGSWHRNSA